MAYRIGPDGEAIRVGQPSSRPAGGGGSGGGTGGGGGNGGGGSSTLVWVVIILIIFGLLYAGGDIFKSWLRNRTVPDRVADNPTQPVVSTTPAPTPQPVPENPYGNGNGKLTIYKTCNYCPDLAVSIDSVYIGTITETLPESDPGCEASGTIATVLTSGVHRLTATDSYGETWDMQVNVTEKSCERHWLGKTVDSKPNPYGQGNGKITFYKTCYNCPDMVVSMDGSIVGTLNETVSQGTTVECDGAGTVSQILTAGSHYLTARDSYGTTWNDNINVTEGECTLRSLQKVPDAAPTQEPVRTQEPVYQTNPAGDSYYQGENNTNGGNQRNYNNNQNGTGNMYTPQYKSVIITTPAPPVQYAPAHNRPQVHRESPPQRPVYVQPRYQPQPVQQHIVNHNVYRRH